jgi:nucleotide-binding universal stress UspA family protein
MSEQEQAVTSQRYVVGVDGSESSLAALRWAVDQARAHGGGGSVRAVQVWELPYSGLASSLAVEPYGLPDLNTIQEKARVRLASTLEAIGDTSPVEVHAELREGQPAAVLCELSRDADLVVVGSRGHGGFAALMLGSVCDQVVRHAKCSVFVVRPHA